MLRLIATRYDKLIRAHPIRTKMASSGLINAAADAVGQLATGLPLDPTRSLLYGLAYGTLWYAPVMHQVTTGWSRILPSTGLPTIIFKSLVDASTTLVLNLSLVIGFQGWYRGQDPLACVRRDLWDSWCLALGFHPGLNVLVYSMPGLYRVLTLNVGQFVWNGWLITRCASRDAKECVEDQLAAEAPAGRLVSRPSVQRQ